MSNNINICVVIRSSNEKTLNICYDLIHKHVSRDSIYIIECVPFENAIKESFKIGINSDCKWLVTADADVLIKPGSIEKMIKIGEGLPKNIFQFEGMLYDGLLLKYRQGGIKFYRTSLLDKAIQLIPKPGTQIRPETYTQDQMAKLGYNRIRVDEVVGIHDYDQYPKDIYRKAFVHGRKFKNEVYGLIPIWKYLKRSGFNNYDAAIKGGLRGIKNNNNINLDINELHMISEGIIFSKEKDLFNYKGNVEKFILTLTDNEQPNLNDDKYRLFLDYASKYNLYVACKWLFRRIYFKIFIN